VRVWSIPSLALLNKLNVLVTGATTYSSSVQVVGATFLFTLATATFQPDVPR